MFCIRNLHLELIVFSLDKAQFRITRELFSQLSLCCRMKNSYRVSIIYKGQILQVHLLGTNHRIFSK